MASPESKRSPDPFSVFEAGANVRRIAAIHAEASQHRDELLDEARQLLAAGRIRDAKRLVKTAREIHSQLQALEAQVRMSSK